MAGPVGIPAEAKVRPRRQAWWKPNSVYNDDWKHAEKTNSNQLANSTVPIGANLSVQAGLVITPVHGLAHTTEGGAPANIRAAVRIWNIFLFRQFPQYLC